MKGAPDAWKHLKGALSLLALSCCFFLSAHLNLFVPGVNGLEGRFAPFLWRRGGGGVWKNKTKYNNEKKQYNEKGHGDGGEIEEISRTNRTIKLLLGALLHVTSSQVNRRTYLYLKKKINNKKIKRD